MSGSIGAVDTLTLWIRVLLDAAGVVVIALGAVQAFIALPKAIHGERRFTAVRLDFARYLALALEFQLAADVLQTAVTPTLDQLGLLAAIATIRTALNFFLAREMKDERTLVGEDGARSS